MLGLVCAVCVFTQMSAIAKSYDALPERAISLVSPEGQAIFQNSNIKQDFWQLIPHYISQKNLYYCGIASAVMVLNALNISAPFDPNLSPYSLFTQKNFFNKEIVEQVFSPSDVDGSGVKFEDLAKALELHGVKVQIFYTSKKKPETVKKNLIAALKTPDTYVLAFFVQKYLFDKGKAHVSPVAAYDEKSDRFLILDVARFQRPPVWVSSSDLYQAMSLSYWGYDNEIRGYLLISRV